MYRKILPENVNNTVNFALTYELKDTLDSFLCQSCSGCLKR